MPSIDREKARNKNWRSDHQLHRYIRQEGVIYYSEDHAKDHAGIAAENGIEKAHSSSGRTLVDDGGTILLIKGMLAFESGTSSCEIIGSQRNANAETYRVARQTFGEDVVSQ
jgi:hypothetical protein